MIDAVALERCLAAGGIAVFAADTVYGLGCDPGDAAAVGRLYALKRRPAAQPAAVMFFDLDAALAALPELGARTAAGLRALLPGPLTALLPNPAARFRLACGDDPATLGLRVPDLGAGPSRPMLQSSANRTGEPDARRLADVDREIRAAADLVLDGGELPGTPSTVLDLRGYERDGAWTVVRPGALDQATLAQALVRSH